MKKQKFLVLLTLLLMSALVLAACGGGNTDNNANNNAMNNNDANHADNNDAMDNDAADNDAADDDAMDDMEESPLVVGTTDSWTSFEPAWVYSFHDWEIFHNIADGLLNSVEGGAGAVYPALAESYDVSDDGLVYTFHLREGVTFPDGTPFNADAVVFSLERVAVVDAAEGENAGFLYSAYTTGVEKIDDMTVAVTFADNFAFSPQLVATNVWKILNPNVYSADSAGTTLTAGGIGPYVIESFTEGEELVLVANESYYGTAPVESKVIIRYFADSSTMALALQTGEIDIAWKSLSPADTDAMRAVDGVTVDSQPGTEIRYIVFNTNFAPFDNADVRLGLAKLLDRQELADLGFQGTKVPLNSMVPVGFLGHKPSYEGSENMDEALALLASAGFTADNPLVMDLWYSPTHYGDTEADIAAIMKSQFEASGVVEVSLQFLEWGAYRDAGRVGETPVALYGWYPDYLDSDNYVGPFVPGTWAAGPPGFVNDDVSALITEQASEGDEAARIAVLGDLQDLWVTQSPMVPFAQGSLFVAYNDGISGVTLDPLALFHYFLVDKE
ncbi:MAG: peptide ABC transporter substrate-binding protein [Chloroflexi bacterium]|jgi:peptide/nickel transport system substrate-binding protein|nr:peptide ABC transporter substrate-binding protein [Chloroflexota bacterium]MBT3670365.1 peptide ABC transporter substrate-binding protein [Chloroflexota bacterium]MBT4305552.1 peptide ABC transporter substrate-binding protein [Chloroflexota bacterium]MBT4533164.1 peptide ABC transporter substrate-binding protein [Chloroflexota bacterium]MBT4682054.1 peptide ABC transporter substrate-binding protein [Chloroflexota bacterium]